MIDVEVVLVFFTALIFSLLFVAKEEVLYGAISFVAWLATGLLWLPLAQESPSYFGTYVVAWLFFGVAVLFLIATIMQLLERLRQTAEQSDLD